MELCRTCMNERGNEIVGDEFFSIFAVPEDEDVDIAECLSQWVGYSIQKHDGLPSEVCLPCMEAIKSISFFIQNAKECDQKLKRLLDVGTPTIYVEHDSSSDSVKLEESSVEQMYNTEGQKLKRLPDVGTPTTEVEYESSSDSVKLEESSVEQMYNTEGQHTDEELDIKQLPIVYDSDAEQISDEEFIADLDSDSSSDENGREKLMQTKIETDDEFVPKSKAVPQKDHDELDEKELETYNVIEMTDKIVCCGCFLLFDSEEELKLHGVKVHQETRKLKDKNIRGKNVECKFCYKRYYRKGQCQNHRKPFDATKKLFECKKCNKRIINPKTRRRHAHNHPEWTVALPNFFPVPLARLEKNGYLCCVRGCISAANSEDALFEHIKNDHSLSEKSIEPFKSDKSFQCVFCFKLFDSKVKLDNHFINKYNTLTHQCHQCGKIFRSAEFLKAHENRHADIKPYECDICFKRYYSAAVLKQHRITHTQEKSLKCTICGVAFRTKIFLENHYRTHSDVKPFKCDICHKKFKHTSSLFSHKKTHDPGKHVKCTECGKGFADTTNLKRHMVSHTGIKPYPCDSCEKRFMRLGERSEHVSVVHLGIMPYRCESCDAGFTTKRSFQKHELTCMTVLG